MRVFVTGGTGLVGTRLIRRLRARQDDVVILTRNLDVAQERFGNTCTITEGDPTQAGDWMNEVDDCDAVVNLAGENIFRRRWNDEFKSMMRESRVRSTENVVQALARHPHTSLGDRKVLVNASAVGYYGPHGDELLTEDSPPGNDVLAQLCVDWERSALTAESSGLRVVVIRTGLVLDRTGGALAKMLPAFQWFGGGPIGSGNQWVSWIHYEDLIGIYLLALDHHQAQGPMNGTSPRPVTNRVFAKELGRALQRPSFLKAPKFALRWLLGEVADVVTTGQRVLPEKAESLGYTFSFVQIADAFQDILSRENQSIQPAQKAWQLHVH